MSCYSYCICVVGFDCSWCLQANHVDRLGFTSLSKGRSSRGLPVLCSVQVGFSLTAIILSRDCQQVSYMTLYDTFLLSCFSSYVTGHAVVKMHDLFQFLVWKSQMVYNCVCLPGWCLKWIWQDCVVKIPWYIYLQLQFRLMMFQFLVWKSQMV